MSNFVVPCHSISSAMQLMDDGVIAILGPQTSDDSYFMAAMAEENHIPLVSFTATDPALSQLQYPYFIRVVPSDAVQMAAIASIIDYYEWKEVVALFTDDDFGRNAIYALRNSLEKIGSRISYKVALDPNIGKVGFQKVLLDLHKIKPRVILVHMQPDLGQTLLSVAIHLKMFNSSYVWIVTDGTAGILDTLPLGVDSLTAPEGIICTQVYIPPSFKFKYLYYELRKRLGSRCCEDQNLRAVAFYAYDALSVIAKAVHSLLNQKNYDLSGGPDTPSVTFNPANGRESTDVSPLLHQIQKTRFLGTTGLIGFDAKGDRLHSVFEIINKLETGRKAVGYWTSSVGYLTIQPPSTIAESTFNATKRVKEPSLVTWPRGSSKVSRGRMPSMIGRPLRIIVPHKAGFETFVGVDVKRHNKTTASGFCIEVFTAALAYLKYNVSYTFTAFGTGQTTPNYDDLIQKVADKEFDAAVGDITITRKRSNIVQFTQPFLESSLTVVVPKLLKKSSRTWQFFRPFSISMWCTMGVCFIITGVVIWVLERRNNKDFRGRPKKMISTIIWFILSTLFFTQREKVKSVLGRMVLIVWFFVVLIITSSYTANLTSILTIEQLRPTVNGIGGLITSDDPIGYQSGSFVRDYLLELNVAKERLVPLNTLQNYRNALLSGPQRGGVAAIVEEKPYADLFISQRCEFKTSGAEFSKGDWGFVFQKGSQLAIDISTAILKLNEDGTLQRIRDKYLGNSTCESSDEISSHLGTSAFLGLFLITGIVSIVAIISYCVSLARLFCVVREEDIANEEDYRENSSKCASIMHSVKSFLKFITKEEIPRHRRKDLRYRSKIRKQEKKRAKNGSTSGSSLGTRVGYQDHSFSGKTDDEDQSVNPSLHRTQSPEIEGFGSEGELTFGKRG
ncbi:glutamate receptor 3.3 isoform X2 [Cryptomeria japonica]|uniref:glutamate receptor 3.3 isoform X2 n=1 Tax=Cryptomeria japonica TaxID=3369 RepID=UPI0027DA82EC|nr:glutamate receptor 3.3 isoform X2 [Cryptomeria japonica]